MLRKTKIVCTLGPSTDQEGVMRNMIVSGMNVARFNFSHGSHEEHAARLAKLRALRDELCMPVAALLDTKGPEIRLKNFKNGKVTLKAGQTLRSPRAMLKATKTSVPSLTKNCRRTSRPARVCCWTTALSA